MGKKEKPERMQQQPTKRSRTDDTHSNLTPAAKKAKAMTDNLTLEKGQARPSIVSVPWPLPANLP